MPLKPSNYPIIILTECDMPIEIKELHIKINVSEDAKQAEKDSGTGDSKEKIIEACVEQVMEILARREER